MQFIIIYFLIEKSNNKDFHNYFIYIFQSKENIMFHGILI